MKWAVTWQGQIVEARQSVSDRDLKAKESNHRYGKAAAVIAPTFFRLSYMFLALADQWEESDSLLKPPSGDCDKVAAFTALR